MSQDNLKKYYGCIDFSVHNNSQTQAFLFLREHCESFGITAPRVLEIGCSIGYFSHALRDNGVYVYGVEPFSREAEINGYVNEFFHGTVEDFIRDSGPELLQSFDAVILGDVLEHLVEPEKNLVALIRFLKPNGVIIVSVPNITHIGIRRMLEHGEWMYQKYGLLDSTHIHFFTWRSLREMLIRAGFGIERRYDVLMPEINVYPSVQSVENYAQPCISKDHAFQFIVKASRQALSSEAFADSLPRNILLISTEPLSCVTMTRMIEPLRAYLTDVGGELRVVVHCSAELLNWADVLITHRGLFPETLEVIRQARELGLSVVYDLDDLLMKLPAWSKAQVVGLGQVVIEQVAATANRVTCSTGRLRDELQKYTDNLTVVPNAIIKQDPAVSLAVKHSGTNCTLVVAASDPALTDFLVGPVRILCEKMPELGLVTIGPVNEVFSGLSSRVRQYDLCSPEEFSQILLGIENGIGLIHLDDSLFSSCKSPIKFYHYASCGLVTVASAVPPYADCIVDGQNGLLVNNTHDAWCRAIFRLSKDDRLRQLLLARAIRTWQIQGSKKNTVNAWKEVFKNLPKPGARTLWATR